MKPILLLFSLILTCFSLAQEKKATINGTVKDYDQKSKVGEVIIFENLKTKEKKEVISDNNGQYQLKLDCGFSYQIIIQGFNEDQDYTKFEIPELEENQSDLTFQIDIQYEAPKVFTLDNVHYESGKASLTKPSYTELQELLEYLQLKKTTVIEIAGHTDDVGEPNANLTLSKKRAEAVKDFLVKNGIEESRLIAKGYGETEPIADNGTSEGRAKNRRTEVRILKN